MSPLAIDLFCGLGGWTEGLLSEGWRVVGFDIERHVYPRRTMQTGGDDALKLPKGNSTSRLFTERAIARISDLGDRSKVVDGEWDEYPAQLVLQDVRTLHGSQFKGAHLIVASSPCQEFSYRAMPWKRAKALPPPYFGMELFAQAARIQREASEAAGRYIPMVQENVRGAQKWVGKAAWHYGSYYLWGDVPALMPMTFRAEKNGGNGSWFYGNAATGGNPARGITVGEAGTKNTGGSWFNIGSPGQKVTNQNPVTAMAAEGVKNKDADGYERDHPAAFGWKKPRTSSHSQARRAASAAIAKIPFPLAQYIARAWWPSCEAVAVASLPQKAG